MPTTVGRSRGRQGVHSGAQGAAGDHMRKIMATLITAIVVLVAVLVLTKAGREIDAATQRFMLYYAGVLALVGLTGSVLLGLLATDRIVMTPGHRVMAQAVHRAFSFGTLAFLVIHIVTEILAQRSHVIDAIVPFLSPYRTFYIGLGTIASDLIVLLVVTSIVRKRFTEHGKAWRWRAIHYASYVAFVFGVLHGLLGGRTAKPYVDWSYGFAIAVTALGLAVRFLAISLRPKESLPSSPSADRARAAGSSSLHAAAMGLAQARLGGGIGGTVQVLPAGLGGQGVADSWAALPAPGWSPASGPLPALGPAPPYAGSPADDYRDLGFMPLGAPPYGDDGQAGHAGSSLRVRGPGALGAVRARPATALRARVRRTAPVRGRAAGTRRHTPGRAVLLPVRTAGPQARVAVCRGLPGPSGIRAAGHPAGYGGAGPSPGRATRPAPSGRPEFRPDTSAQNRSDDSAWSADSARPGPDAAARHGPVAAGWSGAAAAQRDGSGYGADAACGHGPHAPGRLGPCPGPTRVRCPRRATGPMPRLGTGPMPRPDTGPMPRAGQGPPPRNGMGPGTGPMPRPGTGPMPRLGTGPTPRFDGRPDAGPMPRPDTGGMPSRPERRPDAAVRNWPDAVSRKRPDAPSGHRPDAPPRSHAPSRSAVAGWRPGHRSAHRPAAADCAARVAPGQAH